MERAIAIDARVLQIAAGTALKLTENANEPGP
jgi:hypothetical protein